jgi:uncharacterized membrane protein YkoI
MKSWAKYTTCKICFLLAALLIAVQFTAPSAFGQERDMKAVKGSIAVTKGANLKSLAKISEEAARAAAMARFPGSKVSEIDLENEDGFLVYAVELMRNGEEIDVLVDAGNGAVLKFENEDGDAEAVSEEDEEHEDEAEMEEDDEDGEASAQTALPSAVKAAFATAYPKARILGSDAEAKDGVTYYEIESVDGETRRDLLYYGDGRLYEAEETVAFSSLPAPVRAAAMKHGKLVKAERITRGATTEFEVIVEMDGMQHALVLDPAGKVLEMSMMDEGEDNN